MSKLHIIFDRVAVGVLIVLAACFFCMALAIRSVRHTGRSALTREQTDDLSRLASLISGSIVYQRESSNLIESIYRTDIGSTQTVLLARDGRYPRWSPDGSQIAFLRKGAVMLMNRDGSGVETLVPDAGAKAIAWRPDGSEVLFTSGESVLAVNVSNRIVREIVSGMVFAGMDIDSSGRRVVLSARDHNIYVSELPGGKLRRIARGCSVSFSPDAAFFLHNNGGHRRLTIRQWPDGKIIREIIPPVNFCENNVKWSNHPDWITLRTEGSGTENVFLHRISENRAYQVTFCGDANRPDLFVNMKDKHKGERKRCLKYQVTKFFLRRLFAS